MLFELVSLSVVLSLVCTEFTGLFAGGLVSAGYFAYYFHEPSRLTSTLVVAVLICLVVKLLQHVLILYGRRRFALSLILSLAAVWALEKTFFLYSGVSIDVRVIGYIIPGLIASDMEKQGVFKTLGVLAAITLVIRLVVVLGL